MVERKSPTPTTREDGELEVTPAAVDFGHQEKIVEVTLSAAGGPLTWQAVTSSARITLSADNGTLEMGDERVVTVTFRRGLLELPGQETITFTDSGGDEHTVAVTWQGSLL